MQQPLWALRLERRLDKAAMLEQYLNRVPLGQSAVGVEAAADLYFGAIAGFLSLGEASLLAGLAHAPSSDNPLVSAGRARARRAATLARLATAGYAGAEEIERGDVSLLELANGYRALAGGGVYRPVRWHPSPADELHAPGRRVMSPTCSRPANTSSRRASPDGGNPSGSTSGIRIAGTPARSPVPSHHRGDPDEVLALTTYIKLVRAAESVAARVWPGIAAAGLTESQFGVLEALHHLGPLHQRDLAARILKTPGNLSVVVRNLGRRGLVRRARSAHDRRFVRVELTPRGAALIRRVFPGHAAKLTAELSVLSPGEQRALGRLCGRLGLGLGRRRGWVDPDGGGAAAEPCGPGNS